MLINYVCYSVVVFILPSMSFRDSISAIILFAILVFVWVVIKESWMVTAKRPCRDISMRALSTNISASSACIVAENLF